MKQHILKSNNHILEIDDKSIVLKRLSRFKKSRVESKDITISIKELNSITTKKTSIGSDYAISFQFNYDSTLKLELNIKKQKEDFEKLQDFALNF